MVPLKKLYILEQLKDSLHAGVKEIQLISIRCTSHCLYQHSVCHKSIHCSSASELFFRFRPASGLLSDLLPDWKEEFIFKRNTPQLAAAGIKGMRIQFRLRSAWPGSNFMRQRLGCPAACGVGALPPFHLYSFFHLQMFRIHQDIPPRPLDASLDCHKV